MIEILKKYLNQDIKKYYFESHNVDEKKYLSVVSNYIQYYHYRAWSCKHWFYALSSIKLFALASVMVVQATGLMENISAYAACSSAVCLLIEGLIALMHLQEKWILYRNTNNSLMGEVRRFATSEGKYSNNNEGFLMFVNTVESMIGDEARKWNETMQERNQTSGIVTNNEAEQKKNSENN